MTGDFNDSPIESLEHDLFQVMPFAKSIATSLQNIKSPVGTAIGIHGPWGSGKSSAVNLIRRELEKEETEDLVISEFRCWWFRGEEALALAFLQNLQSLIAKGLGDEVKDMVPRLGKLLLSASKNFGPSIAVAAGGPPGLGSLIEGGASFAESYFSETETVESLFEALQKSLGSQNKRFLIIIDDIDRLSAKEALAIFRLVKTIGRLPNVMYLLVFDREFIESAVNEEFSKEGPHFLEKIIQAGFELPQPNPMDLQKTFLTLLAETCGADLFNSAEHRIWNMYLGCVQSYINSPRDISRFSNSISVTWPAIGPNVNIADFMTLEVLRLNEPALFQSISLNKANVLGQSGLFGREKPEIALKRVLRGFSEERHSQLTQILTNLFPQLENQTANHDWDAERRVCVEAHFDTYFRYSLSDETLSESVVVELIEKSHDADFLKKELLSAASQRRRNGQSMVPVYLEALKNRANRLPKENVLPLLTTVFNLHDRIDLECDDSRGFIGGGDTSLRVHWLMRRLVNRHFSLEERDRLYLEALESASLAWFVSFTRFASEYYEGENGRTERPENCLVLEKSVPELNGKALNAIREAAKEGSLLAHRDLVYLLFCWIKFLNDDHTEVLEWSNSQLADDEAIVTFADRFVGESSSISGNDYFSVKTPAIVSDLGDLIDLCELSDRAQGILSHETLAPEKREKLQIFLDALSSANGQGNSELDEL